MLGLHIFLLSMLRVLPYKRFICYLQGFVIQEIPRQGKISARAWKWHHPLWSSGKGIESNWRWPRAARPFKTQSQLPTPCCRKGQAVFRIRKAEKAASGIRCRQTECGQHFVPCPAAGTEKNVVGYWHSHIIFKQFNVHLSLRYWHQHIISI